MYARNDTEWTIERWRIDSDRSALGGDLHEAQAPDDVPPLWKDLTVAVIAAVLLWGAAVAVFS